jgi:hypothetical protein
MYGENGAQMRTELAALLRQHRVMHRLAADPLAERAEVGQQILRFRRTLIVWCTQAIRVAQPLTFPNIPQKPADPFRPTSEHGAAIGELARALDLARDQGTTPAASSTELATPSSKDVVERWRLAARAAALAEHDTATDLAVHLTAAQARTIAGDVATVSQALVVLDRRYRNTPGWESLTGGDRLGWAAGTWRYSDSSSMLISGSSPLSVDRVVSMLTRCATTTVLASSNRADSVAPGPVGHAAGCWTEFSVRFRYEDQVRKCFQARNP